MNKKIRGLQVANHLLLFVVVIFNGVSLYELFLSFIIYLFILTLGISVGFHRLFSHNSFQADNVIAGVLLFLGTITTLGSSIGWAAVHRHHHKFSDKDEDIHSPRANPFRAWVGLWKQQKMSPLMIRDLMDSPIHLFFHKYYFYILFGWMVFLFLAFDINGLVVAYTIPSILCLHMTSIINVTCHSKKSLNERTRDYSKNIPLLSILSGGESYHYNHHLNPKNIRFGRFDISYYVIKFFLQKGNKNAH